MGGVLKYLSNLNLLEFCVFATELPGFLKLIPLLKRVFTPTHTTTWTTRFPQIRRWGKNYTTETEISRNFKNLRFSNRIMGKVAEVIEISISVEFSPQIRRRRCHLHHPRLTQIRWHPNIISRIRIRFSSGFYAECGVLRYQIRSCLWSGVLRWMCVLRRVGVHLLLELFSIWRLFIALTQHGSLMELLSLKWLIHTEFVARRF